MKLKPDQFLTYRPEIRTKHSYSDSTYQTLFDAIKQNYVAGEKYKITEIWHNKGYSLFCKNNSRNEEPNEKIYYWGGQRISKKEKKYQEKYGKCFNVDGKLYSERELEKLDNKNGKYWPHENTICIRYLGGVNTIYQSIIEDNFVNLKKERKLKLQKLYDRI